RSAIPLIYLVWLNIDVGGGAAFGRSLRVDYVPEKTAEPTPEGLEHRAPPGLRPLPNRSITRHAACDYLPHRHRPSASTRPPTAFMPGPSCRTVMPACPQHDAGARSMAGRGCICACRPLPARVVSRAIRVCAILGSLPAARSGVGDDNEHVQPRRILSTQSPSGDLGGAVRVVVAAARFLQPGVPHLRDCDPRCAADRDRN